MIFLDYRFNCCIIINIIIISLHADCQLLTIKEIITPSSFDIGYDFSSSEIVI
jgi:hypothetical protein